VTELVKLVGLPGSEDKFPAQLSGGQQQRIALARALATSPGLLLLDEPLSALDAIVRVHLRSEIRSLQRKLGVTTIMVTHDQEEALSVADRIVVMNHGRDRAGGHADGGLPRAGQPFVADFVGRINVLPAAAEAGGRPARGPTSFDCVHDATRRARRQGLPAARGRAGPAHCAGRQQRVRRLIEKIEFLGSYCLVRVASPALGDQRLTVYLSLNFLAEHAAGGGRPPAAAPAARAHAGVS
jgi:iron(III) transport system ATP-binding protein